MRPCARMTCPSSSDLGNVPRKHPRVRGHVRTLELGEGVCGEEGGFSREEPRFVVVSLAVLYHLERAVDASRGERGVEVREVEQRHLARAEYERKAVLAGRPVEGREAAFEEKLVEIPQADLREEPTAGAFRDSMSAYLSVIWPR